MTDRVLALDAGTGGGRAAVFDRTGRVYGEGARAWRASAPEALAPFGQEYDDPDAVFEAVLAAARDALRSIERGRITAIAVSGARVACAFLDGAGQTLYLGPNGDIRAIASGWLEDLDPDALYRTTGRFPPWIFAPARLRWFEREAPEVFERIETVLGFPDWVAHRLGAAPHTDPTIAADLMMLSVVSRARQTVGDDRHYPPVVEPGAVIGALSGRAAAALDLDEGVPLVQGAADTALAVLGAGVPDHGTLVVAGTTAPIVRVMSAPTIDVHGRLWTDPHVLADRWLYEANLGEMGTLHAWWRDVLLGPEASFERCDELAASAPVGCRGASAHLGPRAMDLRALNTGRPAALLMPFGQTRGGAPPGRAELLRAYLESCAFAIKAGSEWLDEVTPGSSPMTLAGGMGRSALLGQILASVLGREVVRGDPDASLRGAAMCAALGAGWFDSLSGASRAMRSGDVRHTPDEDDVDAYEDAYDRWLEREEQLEEF